jgi:hypothetical protein
VVDSVGVLKIQLFQSYVQIPLTSYPLPLRGEEGPAWIEAPSANGIGASILKEEKLF